MTCCSTPGHCHRLTSIARVIPKLTPFTEKKESSDVPLLRPQLLPRANERRPSRCRPQWRPPALPWAAATGYRASSSAITIHLTTSCSTLGSCHRLPSVVLCNHNPLDDFLLYPELLPQVTERRPEQSQTKWRPSALPRAPASGNWAPSAVDSSLRAKPRNSKKNRNLISVFEERMVFRIHPPRRGLRGKHDDFLLYPGLLPRVTERHPCYSQTNTFLEEKETSDHFPLSLKRKLNSEKKKF